MSPACCFLAARTGATGWTLEPTVGVVRTLRSLETLVLLPDTTRVIANLDHQFSALLQIWNQLASVAATGSHACCATALLRSVPNTTADRERDPERGRGRPPVPIDGDQIVYLHSCGFSWSRIAEMHLVHRSTIWRRCQALGIPTSRLVEQ